MQAEEIVVEVRDINLTRVGIIPSGELSLKARVEHNNVGSWTLELPAEHELVPALSAPGAGIIVTSPWGTMFSGPATEPTYSANAGAPSGAVTFVGVTDDILLADALAYPTPGTANVAAQTKAYDIRTGKAESVIHAYVRANIGPSAPAVRRHSLLDMGADLGRGQDVRKSARFQVLGEILGEVAAPSRLGYRVIQRGSRLVFETYEVTDRTQLIRLDVDNGTIASQVAKTTGPAVTHAIVAGQGEGEERQLLERTTPESLAGQAAYRRRIEKFIDQRQTDDVKELEQAGDKVLAEQGLMSTAIQATAADDTTMAYGYDWGLGDAVTVVVRGAEKSAIVTAAVLSATSDGVKLGAAIGDLTTFTPTSAQATRVTDVERRLSAIERTIEVATTFGASAITSGTIAEARLPTSVTKDAVPIARIPALTLDKIPRMDNAHLPTYVALAGGVNLDTITTPGFYYQGGNANAASGANYPSASAGVLEVSGHSQFAVQRYTVYREHNALMFWRNLYGGVWGPWKSAGGGPFAQASGIGTVASTGETNAFTFTLPAGRFTVPPFVFIQGSDRDYGVNYVGAATSPTVVGARYLKSAPGITLTYHWTAVQMTPTSAAG